MVIERVVHRAESVTDSGTAPQHRYQKKSVVEELDAAGKVIKTTENLFQVTPIDGVPFARLVRTHNRELSRQEAEEQDRKEAAFRKRLSETDAEAADEAKDGEIDLELVERYDFQVEKRENIDNRRVLVLAFQPKAKRRPEKGIADKVLDRLAGTVWVDEEEAEVAKVQVHLIDELSLGWFGMVGSINKCDVCIERQRLTDGAWVRRSQTMLINGRKLFSAMRYRTSDQYFSFQQN